MDATESAALRPGPPGVRHNPEVIQAVADAIEAGFTGDETAKIVGVSPITVDRIVSESPDVLVPLRASARRVKAEAWAVEGLAIVDEPLPDNPQLASAAVSRAKNRADFRLRMAGCWDRDTYGERAPQVNVQVNTVVAAFGRLSSPKGDTPED